ncbi:MAG: FAD-dependent oxidoreductase [Desulfobulbales bacterium]|nr:FAD-dependent oxidoreductase [Desulfobulbales bacterium]
MKKYLIIGNGVAGTTAAENIRHNDAAGEIIIVSAEDTPFYYRVRLPDYLGGAVQESQLIAKQKSWYDDNRITLKLSTRVKSIEPGAKEVQLEDGESISYDSLLLANGSQPFIPPVKGLDKTGVFSLHTIADARKIIRAAGEISDVMLIGGGLLGLEAAHGLHNLGKKITVVEFFPRLLPRQLDSAGAAVLQEYFENLGYTFKLGAVAEEITGSSRVAGVTLESGEVLQTEMVIISAGVRPNLGLAQTGGLKTARGIVVDKYLQTSHPGIYAAGDVIEFAERTYGIWPAAMEQGKIAGLNISGGEEPYTGTIMANILKVAGVDVASAGEIDEENRYKSKVVATETVYKKVVINNDKVIGCIMLGDRKNFNRFKKAISNSEDILDELDSLLSG